MLMGNHPATLDVKGRFKVPNEFRKFIEEKFGLECFVTSLTGDFVRVYPLSVWEERERRIADSDEHDPVIMRTLDLVNYYGQITSIDQAGRLLIHPLLRNRALMNGTVAVMGKHTHLDIWNRERFETLHEPRPLTPAERSEVGKHFGK